MAESLQLNQVPPHVTEDIPSGSGEDSFLSCEPFEANSSLSLPSHYELELCNVVSFLNLQASLFNACGPTLAAPQSKFRTLDQALNSYRESRGGCQGTVAACAAFILSYLKNCGKLFLCANSILNDETISMLKILDELKSTLNKSSKLEKNQSRLDSSSKECFECSARKLLVKQVNRLNLSTHSFFCSICLSVFPKKDKKFHTGHELHLKMKDKLIAKIYPHTCSMCSMRFVKRDELDRHAQKHEDESNQTDDTSVAQYCCYLCKIAYQTEADLNNHKKFSLKHAYKKDVAVEVALWQREFASTQRCSKFFESEIDNAEAVLQGHNQPDRTLSTPEDSMLMSAEQGSVDVPQNSSLSSLCVFSNSCVKVSDNSFPTGKGPDSDLLGWEKRALPMTDLINGQSFVNQVEIEEKGPLLVESLCQGMELLHIPMIDSSSSNMHHHRTDCKPSTSSSNSHPFTTDTKMNSLGSDIEPVDQYESPDLEAECGSCGGVFRIFNNDIRLSMDIHIQSDPQHLLAVETPRSNIFEKCSELVLPSAKNPSTSNSPSRKKRKKQSTPKESSIQVSARLQPSGFSSEEHIALKFIQEEEKCLVTKSSKLMCTLCNVCLPRGEVTVMSHLLGKSHVKLSLSQYKSSASLGACKSRLSLLLCYERYFKRTSVIKPHSSMVCDEQGAYTILRMIKGLKKQLSKLLVSEIYDYNCEVCHVPVSIGNKGSHESGKKHLSNLKMLGQTQTSKALLVPRIYYCSLCEKEMHMNCKSSHLQGASHRKKKTQNLG